MMPQSTRLRRRIPLVHRPPRVLRAFAAACCGVTVACAAGPTGSSSGIGSTTTRDFSLTCSIPTERIFDGGPGRDGIPALESPASVSVAQVDFLDDDSRVLGVEINGEARAYPMIILWWHEIINDDLGGEPLLVTYCPLTGSGVAFDPRVNLEPASVFGVSGLIYENNVMMFDRKTESLWTQLLFGAQCGSLEGAGLFRIPVIETTWGHWRSLYPQTTAVSTNTGVNRPYGPNNPYGGYDSPQNTATLFPSSPFSSERLPKELVLGIVDGGPGVAYPLNTLAAMGSVVALNHESARGKVLVTYVTSANTARAFSRVVDGQELSLTVSDPANLILTDGETGSTWNWLGQATAGPLTGKQLSPIEDAHTIFWFSWSVYHPHTVLYQ